VSGSLDALSDALAERREKLLLVCDASRVPALIDCRRGRVPASPRRCRSLLARTESLSSSAIKETQSIDSRNGYLDLGRSRGRSFDGMRMQDIVSSLLY